MSIRDTSIDPRLIESAREEFMEKGFLKADINSKFQETAFQRAFHAVAEDIGNPRNIFGRSILITQSSDTGIIVSDYER